MLKYQDQQGVGPAELQDGLNETSGGQAQKYDG